MDFIFQILAKLACGLHKPNQQTLLPPSSVPNLFESIPIKKVRFLGGKLGNRVKHEFNCEFMSDLAKIPLNNLRKKFDEKTWYYLINYTYFFIRTIILIPFFFVSVIFYIKFLKVLIMSLYSLDSFLNQLVVVNHFLWV